MNEHIKALAEQTDEWFEDHSYSRPAWNDKFAELIVKEVIAVYNHDGFQTPSEQDYLVLKHFGVK